MTSFHNLTPQVKAVLYQAEAAGYDVTERGNQFTFHRGDPERGTEEPAASLSVMGGDYAIRRPFKEASIFADRADGSDRRVTTLREFRERLGLGPYVARPR